ncbi:hypothetical protein BC828DRAFT_375524 [Blastocladiella britannica]|nr:hypothetical protein BC828DRAFT_375524 [Blastocladiella britannica]
MSKCAAAADCLAAVPASCPASLAECASTFCASSLGDRVRALTSPLAAATGADGALTLRSRAAAIRDAQDLLAACVLASCPDTYASCLATTCLKSAGKCVVSAPEGSTCAVQTDCANPALGPAGPTTAPSASTSNSQQLLQLLWDPAATDPTTGAFLVPDASVASTVTAALPSSSPWGGLAASPFATLGFAPVRSAYCHPISKTCRSTQPLGTVAGASSPAYPVANSNDTVLAAPASSVPAGGRAQPGAFRCSSDAQCPVGVCSAHLRMCSVDRPMHVQALSLAGAGATPAAPLIPLWGWLVIVAGSVVLVVVGALVYARRRRARGTAAAVANGIASDDEKPLSRAEITRLAAAADPLRRASYMPSTRSTARPDSYVSSGSGGTPQTPTTLVVPGSPGQGGDRSSYYFDHGAAKKGDSTRSSVVSDDFWRFERPDFDKTVGFRRSPSPGGSPAMRASSASGSTVVGSTGAPTRASMVSIPSSPDASADPRASWIGGAHHDSSRRGSGAMPQSPGLPPKSPRTPRGGGHRRNVSNVSAGSLSPVTEDEDDEDNAAGSRRPGGAPVPASARASMVVGTRRHLATSQGATRPASAVATGGGYLSGSTVSGGDAWRASSASMDASRRGSVLDKPLPVSPSMMAAAGPHVPSSPLASPLVPPKPMSPTSSRRPSFATGMPSAAAGHGGPTTYTMSVTAPAALNGSDRDEDDATPRGRLAPLPSFNLIMPTLERTVALKRSASFRSDASLEVAAATAAAAEPDHHQYGSPTFAAASVPLPGSSRMSFASAQGDDVLPASSAPRRGSSASAVYHPAITTPSATLASPLARVLTSPETTPFVLPPRRGSSANVDIPHHHVLLEGMLPPADPVPGAAAVPQMDTLDRALKDLEDAAADDQW